MSFGNHVRRLAPALLAAGALSVAACGESRDFIGGYNAAVGSLDLTPARPATHDGVAGDLDRIASQLHAFRVRLGALKPPSDARHQFTGLLAAVDNYDAELGRVARATRSGDLSRLQKESTRLAQDTQALARAEKAVQAAIEH